MSWGLVEQNPTVPKMSPSGNIAENNGMAPFSWALCWPRMADSHVMSKQRLLVYVWWQLDWEGGYEECSDELSMAMESAQELRHGLSYPIRNGQTQHFPQNARSTVNEGRVVLENQTNIKNRDLFCSFFFGLATGHGLRRPTHGKTEGAEAAGVSR